MDRGKAACGCVESAGLQPSHYSGFRSAFLKVMYDILMQLTVVKSLPMVDLVDIEQIRIRHEVSVRFVRLQKIR